MKLNEFGDYASQLKKINQYLQENFGYTINMESVDSEKVNSTLKKVLARQAQIANETNVKDYHKIPEYNKTVMVAEALKILLREIAPKRQPKETKVQESKMTQQVKEQPSGSVAVAGPVGGGGIRGGRRGGAVSGPGGSGGSGTGSLPGSRRSGNTIQTTPGPKKGDRKKKHEIEAESIRRVGKRDPNAGAPTPMTDKEMTNQFGPPQLRKPIGKKSQQPTPGDRERLIKGRAPRHESVNPRSVTLENLRTLLEQDLDQAELVLAAKDMVDRIQKMAENLAEMQVEELMPLVDAMKEHFGPDVAQVFNSSVEATLQQALDTIKSTRDGVDNAVLALTGDAPIQSDMGEIPGPEMGGMDAGSGMDGMEVPSEEDFGGDEAMAGDTPAIGREMKPESVSTSALAQAKKILMQGAKNGKVSKQAVKEAALALTQKKKS